MIENTGKSEVRIARVILQMTAKGVLPEFQEFLLSRKLAPELLVQVRDTGLCL